MNESKKIFLRVCVAHRPPFVNVKKKSGKIQSLYGLTSNLLHYIAEATKTRYVLIESVDPSIGQATKFGNWSGLLGMIRRNECDLVINPITPTATRAIAAKFPQPFTYYSAGSVLSGPPRTLLYDLRALVDIFDSRVWFALFVFCLLIPALSTCADRLTRPVHGRRRLNSSVHFSRFWASFMTQSITFVGFSTGSRILMTFWIVGCFCLTASYKGDIYSKLTLPAKPEYIETLIDILKYPGLRVVTADSNYEEELMRDSTDPKFQLVFQQVLNTAGVLPLAETSSRHIVKEVLKGDSAVVTSTTRNYDVAARYCTPGTVLHIANGVQDVGYALALRKDFPKIWEEAISLLFDQYFASAHFDYQMRRTMFNASCTWRNPLEAGIDTPLALHSIGMCFQLWLIAMSLSTLVFCSELLYRNCSRKLAIESAKRIGPPRTKRALVLTRVKFVVSSRVRTRVRKTRRYVDMMKSDMYG